MMMTLWLPVDGLVLLIVALSGSITERQAFPRGAFLIKAKISFVGVPVGSDTARGVEDCPIHRIANL
jgi:hypothetical protein